MEEILVAVTQSDRWQTQGGLWQSQLSTLKRLIGTNGVVCPLDKEKHSLVVLCPKYWQATLLKFSLNQHVDFYVKPNIAGEFENIFDSMQYSKACTRKSHSFGLLSWWPKRSGFQEIDGKIGDKLEFVREKFRPTGSYFRHRFRSFFSSASRCIAHVYSKVLPLTQEFFGSGKDPHRV
jgi:hypothetical protein